MVRTVPWRVVRRNNFLPNMSLGYYWYPYEVCTRYNTYSDSDRKTGTAKVVCKVFEGCQTNDDAGNTFAILDRRPYPPFLPFSSIRDLNDTERRTGVWFLIFIFSFFSSPLHETKNNRGKAKQNQLKRKKKKEPSLRFPARPPQVSHANKGKKEV